MRESFHFNFLMVVFASMFDPAGESDGKTIGCANFVGRHFLQQSAVTH
jgi:hypothetical protein